MIVDLIILVLIGVCIFLGAKRGLVLSLISALSLVIALMLGYLLMPVVGGVLARTPLATSTEQTVYTYVSEAVTSEEGYEKALANRERRTFTATTLDELVEIANNNNGYIKAMWCGELDCELKLKETADVTSRCIPFGMEPVGDKCVCCGREAKKLVLWGKAY
mgnify:CR=1 FL=1